MGLKRQANLILLAVLLTAFLASLPIIPTVQAETIELVYDTTEYGYSKTTWRLGPYSMLWQTFIPSEDCFGAYMRTTLGDANAAHDNAFFYGIIYEAYLSGSYYYPNTTGPVYGWTGYLNRYDFHSPATWYNLTILDDAQLQQMTHGERYAFCLVKYNGTWSDAVGYRLFWYMANHNYDTSNNHGADSYADVFDHPLQVYADTDIATPPAYSNVGNGAVHNGYSTTCYSYWAIDKGLLDGYYFEHNATGTPTNSSYTYFVTQTGDWANASISLDGNLGDVVAYKTYAQNTAGGWNATGYSYFTISATITFFYNDGGTLRRNGITIDNATETTYSTPTNLTMLAVPIGGAYSHDYFAWYAGTETDDDNPLTWSVDWSTSFYCYFTDAEAGEPDPYEPPIIPPEGSTAYNLYWQCETQTVANVTGYGASNSAPTIDEHVSLGPYSITGNATFTVGWRIFLQYYGGSSVEITNGQPQAQASTDWTHANGNPPTDETPFLLNSEYEMDERILTFGKTALKFYLYYRWNDTGAWQPIAVYISDYLFYSSIQESTINMTVWSYYHWDEVDTSNIHIFWGGSEAYEDIDGVCGVYGLYFATPRSSDYQRYYLNAGNFLAFLTIPYTAVIGNVFYGLILLGIAGSIYIRYREMSMVLIFFVLLGGAGGVVNLILGDLFAGIAWLACAFGLGLVYWRLFR